MTRPVSILTLRRALMIVAPLALGVVELWHYLPSLSASRFEDLAPQVDQWLTVHMIQLPFFGLLALAIFLLTDTLGHPRPFGPIGMALFAAGAAWLEIVPKRTGVPLARPSP